MIVVLLIGLVLAMVGYQLVVLPPVSVVARDAPAAETVAAAMLVYQKAAVQWCLDGTCPDGVVPPDALVLPPGYARVPWLTATAEGGRISTYAGGLKVDAHSIAASLGDLTAGGPSSGLAAAGTGGVIAVAARDFVAGQRIAVVANADVPAGVPVVSQKAK